MREISKRKIVNIISYYYKFNMITITIIIIKFEINKIHIEVH